MSENSQEQLASSERSHIEVASAAAEQSTELAKNREVHEHSPEQQAEAIDQARAEANKEALMGKERGGAEAKNGGEPTHTAIRKVTKKEKDVEYKKTLKEIRSQMNTPSRAFSRVIHFPIIEKTSDIVSGSLARPNAIVAGSTMSFVLVVLIYTVAKHYGYPMSGFETIGAFIIGWVIGITYDYFKVMATGGRRS